MSIFTIAMLAIGTLIGALCVLWLSLDDIEHEKKLNEANKDEVKKE